MTAYALPDDREPRTPERTLLITLFWDALRRGDKEWVDGRPARLPFNEVCEYLGFDAKVLRCALQRRWPERLELNDYHYEGM